MEQNKHIGRAMEIRNEEPMVSNCAQAILRTYAPELGLSEEMAAALAGNFGGGMKCGKTCGVISAGLMVLGAKGIASPAVLAQFRKRIADLHDGMTDCADLLRANAERGLPKKPHCDGMICEAIALIDELAP